jgi:hypothetical protein
MQVYLRELTPEKDTPNCVDCSRSIEHAECTVLHLMDDGWLIERGSRSGNLPKIEVQQTSSIGAEELFLERPTKP